MTRRSSFTPAQIAEALAFAREEWPGETPDEQASRAASYLDLVCGQDSHGDVMAQVLEYQARAHVEGSA